ncbi:MAG: beta-ketoacyl-ACP synthase 3, partial [Bdellovibrionales bacterium]|nr:beta-ketoacyl-ACP synthase 3 [Bdellovibrionales bacterium]
PDTVLPNTAARVAGALGCLSTTGALDVNTACAGFVTGLHMADGLIRGGLHKNVLVIGTDVFSHVLDWTDRTTCVLFGDGAGAVVVTAVDSNDEQNDSIILGSKLFHIFDHAEALSIKAGGSRTPFSSPRFNVEERPYVTMQGQDVFKMGTRGMAQAAEEVLKLCGVDKHQLDWFVPHQANIRIIEMVAKLLDMSMDKVYVNIDRWGNSSAATVPVCLAEMNRAGMLKKGQLVLLDVFGGGFAYGALLMRW